MNTIVTHAIVRLNAVSGALDCEPDIRPDLSDLEQSELPVVMLALMNRGIRSLLEIYEYLVDHKAPFDIDDLDLVLGLHEGRNPAECLWRADGEGFFPLIAVA